MRRLLLSCLLALCAAGPAAASSPGPAGPVSDWAALRAPVFELADDPFTRLSTAQLDALREIVIARTLRATGREPPPAAVERVAQAERRLRDEGVDTEGLLALRETVMARRRADAEATVAALEGRAVRLAGYVVPVALDGGRVAEFLLVPWAGACSHEPPPPPNQIVRVRAAEPFEPVGWNVPVHVDGALRVRAHEQTLFVVDGMQAVRSGYAIDGGVVRPARARVP